MLPATAYRVGSILVVSAQLLSCSGPSHDAPGNRASRIHERAVVMDAHAHPKPHEAEALSLGERSEGFELDFLTMEEGGLDAVFFSAPLLSDSSEPPGSADEILEDIRAIVDEVGRHGEAAEIARSPQDIVRIHGLGKRAVLLSLEAPDPFRGELGTIERYFDAGVRMITVAPLALVGPDPERGDAGDSSSVAFMRGVIGEMNRLGMIADISHLEDHFQMEIIRTSTSPVVASHSNTRALNDIPRQIPDSILRALAEKGGVICVTFFPGHVSSDFPDEPATIEDLVDHIDHIVRVAGIDHVGFGSDFLGGENHTVGLESAAGLPAITDALLSRGYSPEEIEKILGGNLLRVFEAVQEGAGIGSI